MTVLRPTTSPLYHVLLPLPFAQVDQMLQSMDIHLDIEYETNASTSPACHLFLPACTSPPPSRLCHLTSCTSPPAPHLLHLTSLYLLSAPRYDFNAWKGRLGFAIGAVLSITQFCMVFFADAYFPYWVYIPNPHLEPSSQPKLFPAPSIASCRPSLLPSRSPRGARLPSTLQPPQVRSRVVQRERRERQKRSSRTPFASPMRLPPPDLELTAVDGEGTNATPFAAPAGAAPPGHPASRAALGGAGACTPAPDRGRGGAGGTGSAGTLGAPSARTGERMCDLLYEATLSAYDPMLDCAWSQVLIPRGSL